MHPMAKSPEHKIDAWTRKLIQATRTLMSTHSNGIASIPELARRMGMTPGNLRNYLSPAQRGYGPWSVIFAEGVAAAFGMSIVQFLELSDAIQGSAATPTATGRIWDAIENGGDEALIEFQRHEEHAQDGIGFFRIPPCTILPRDMSSAIRRNCFAPYGDVGEAAISEYEKIESFYADEYDRGEGRYGNIAVTTLILDSDLRRCIRGEGEFTGCQRWAGIFLEELRSHHVKRFHYNVGFIDDAKVPPEMFYDFAAADSIVLVGSTLSVRRSRETFQLQFAESGANLMRDQNTLRTLLKYADLSQAGIVQKIEAFQREADRSKW